MSIPLFMAAVAMSAMWAAMSAAMWYLNAQSIAMQISDFFETTISWGTRPRSYSARCQHQLLATPVQRGSLTFFSVHVFLIL